MRAAGRAGRSSARRATCGARPPKPGRRAVRSGEEIGLQAACTVRDTRRRLSAPYGGEWLGALLLAPQRLPVDAAEMERSLASDKYALPALLGRDRAESFLAAVGWSAWRPDSRPRFLTSTPLRPRSPLLRYPRVRRFSGVLGLGECRGTWRQGWLNSGPMPASRRRTFAARRLAGSYVDATGESEGSGPASGISGVGSARCKNR